MIIDIALCSYILYRKNYEPERKASLWLIVLFILKSDMLLTP